MKAYGAELVLTQGTLGMKGAIEESSGACRFYSGKFYTGAVFQPGKSAIHKKTTGPEIWRDMDGKVDIFVAGIGTGGTISGAGAYLKEKNPAIRIIGVEPEGSPILTRGHSGAHKIQGIGAGFVPETLDTKVYDEVVTVSDQGRIATGREIAHTEGLLIGISAGAAVFAAAQLAACLRIREKILS